GRIQDQHPAQTPSAFAEIVSDNFPVLLCHHRSARHHTVRLAKESPEVALLGREVQNPAVGAAKHPPIAYRWVWWSAGRRLQRDESPLENALPVQIRQPARTLLENPISGSHALGVSGAFVDHHHRAGLPI